MTHPSRFLVVHPKIFDIITVKLTWLHEYIQIPKNYYSFLLAYSVVAYYSIIRLKKIGFILKFVLAHAVQCPSNRSGWRCDVWSEGFKMLRSPRAALKPGPHQQPYRNNCQLCCLLLRHCSRLLPKRQQRQSNVRLCRSKIRLCSIRQCCFDIVANVDRSLQTCTLTGTTF